MQFLALLVFSIFLGFAYIIARGALSWLALFTVLATLWILTSDAFLSTQQTTYYTQVRPGHEMVLEALDMRCQDVWHLYPLPDTTAICCIRVCRVTVLRSRSRCSWDLHAVSIPSRRPSPTPWLRDPG